MADWLELVVELVVVTMLVVLDIVSPMPVVQVVVCVFSLMEVETLSWLAEELPLV